MNPCTPALRRLMPNAAWRTFLRANPSWHAPVLAVVACAGVAGAPLPARPAPTAMPWIEAPGWVRHTDTMPGYGSGLNGWGTLPGLSAGSLYTSQPLYPTLPVVNTMSEWANLVPREKARVRLALPDYGQQGDNADLPAPLLSGSDTSPVSVPEPATVALVLMGLATIACLRANGNRNRADTLPGCTTSTMETTHARLF